MFLPDRRLIAALSLPLLAMPMQTMAQAPAPAADTFARRTGALVRQQGLFPVFVDKANGRVLIQLPPPDKDGISGRFIHQTILATGLGSTPIGLDRAEMGRAQVLAFHRIGRRVILQAENYGMRADGAGADEQRAVHDSFAVSNIWSGEVEADAPGGGTLVDISSFLTRDALDIAAKLKARKQGLYRQAPALSYIDTASLGAFPDNIDIEVAQTFTTDEPGPDIRGVAPDARAITMTVHHSFVKLPEPGFEPRLYDPRVGTSVQVLVQNFAAPLDSADVYRLVRRFRLEKTEPNAARSHVKKPIVFYVDRAAPEPVRSALVQGASMWGQAFDAAGYIDAFKVEVLPEGVNPMDARYNVINWVHEQTRGWSTGQTIVDPRTGEIIRGVVQLGSLRLRQDKMIFEGLVGADKTGKGGPEDPVRLALARIRQLGMHETGHALGLSHNFAGSTFDNRASTLDYPAPLVQVKGDHLTFEDVYATRAGAWDKFSVKWLYATVPAGAKGRDQLSAWAKDAQDKGMRFIAETDHPYSTQWDNGSDPVKELDHIMEVRRVALAHFGLRNIAQGAPVADLRRVFVPIYLFHRYQVAGVVKLLGGVDYSYAVNGDGHEPALPIAPAIQQQALDALVKTLAPEQLDLPDTLIDLLSDGQAATAERGFDIEVFPSMGGPVFDLPGVATTAADMTLSALLDPERLNRMVEQHRRDPRQMGVSRMVTTLLGAVAPVAGNEGRYAEIRRRVRLKLVADMAGAMGDKALSPTAAAELQAALTGFGAQLQAFHGDAEEMVQTQSLAAMLTGRDSAKLARLAADRAQAPALPPGAPIGEPCWFCETGITPAM
ncbi:zinc-dependent metalloprotease [Novosphingobium rosa]|uniref:zinc-dependent metalloprotease n=1 Tax=Novosphingobium rosa TaxID=76978 RepID=UPI0008371C28|nr:zinc-dependent metalloprotease [Novosphingobium rosa]